MGCRRLARLDCVESLGPRAICERDLGRRRSPSFPSPQPGTGHRLALVRGKRASTASSRWVRELSVCVVWEASKPSFPRHSPDPDTGRPLFGEERLDGVESLGP